MSFQEKLRDFQTRAAKQYESSTVHRQRVLYTDGESRYYDYSLVHPDQGYNTNVLDPFIQRLKQNTRTPLALDLGSGKGYASAYMETNGVNTIQLDISPIGLQDSTRAVCATAWKLPFASLSFDAIHTKDMMTHIPHRFREMLFAELYRVTKPEGLMLICSVNQIMPDMFECVTSQREIITRAKHSGFTLQHRAYWRPTLNAAWNDWYYPFLNARFVLEFQKSIR